jgi:ketosteroid isomerase-like protein
MKNYLLMLCFLFINCLSLKAQKGLDEMIAAEKAFAAYSVANNTKDAFLKFMDTSAIMFKDGEPYKSYDVWLKREKRPGVLSWWPIEVEISDAGDWGYSLGPWAFRPTIKDTTIARGYFFTIWQINKDGVWKFILDIGTDEGWPPKERHPTKVVKEKTSGTYADLLKAEEQLIKLHKTDSVKAYKKYMSSEVVLAKQKTGLNPKSTHKAISQSKKGQIVFAIQNGGIAPGGDLGYVYGTAALNGKKETYLRIWRHEPSGWKIALQLVRL